MRIYIEKYDRYEGELFSDFINTDDFISFSRQTDNRIYEYDQRTMLHVRNLFFKKGVIPSEGKVYECPPYFLSNMRWIREPDNQDMGNDMGSSDIIAFRANAEYSGESFFDGSLSLHRDDHQIIKPSGWNDSPCGLKHLSDNVKVIVKNIGQGNWNEIYSGDECKAIYDIGGSIYSTNIELKRFVSSSKAFYYEPSLIISHWDIDHYISIFQVPDNDLKKICCFFAPYKLISQTSKRAFEKISKNCRFIVPVMPSKSRKVKYKVSASSLYNGPKYSLFVGENSSDKNKSGIMLAVWGKEKCMLLTGDHSYSQIFDDMAACVPSTYELNIVTPHHGGEAGKVKAPASACKFGYAITSTGRNIYGHPLDTYRKELSKMGFKWLRTDYQANDVEVTL